MMLDSCTSDSRATHVSLLTAPVPAAIATIAVRGPGSSAAIALFFRSRSALVRLPESSSNRMPDSLALMPVQAACFGTWAFSSSALAAEQVVLCRTGEEAFEIHCHGGLAVCAAIIDDLRHAQCQIVPAEDWRGDAQGKLEHQAEVALCQAATLKVSAILLAQRQGALRRELNQLLAFIHSQQVAEANWLIEQLLRHGHWGLRLLAPPRLTLAGPPNVGKSSLVNRLVGSQRVLVHHQPGTTRDAVDTTLVAAGWPMILTDTAGMRHTTEEIESQGVHIAARRWQEADVGLLVVDATVGWTQTHEQLLAERQADTIVLLNKCDLVPEAELPTAICERIYGLVGAQVRSVRTDTASAEGTHDLLVTLGRHWDHVMPDARAGVPFLVSQVETLGAVQRLLRESDRDQAAISSASGLVQQLLD